MAEKKKKKPAKKTAAKSRARTAAPKSTPAGRPRAKGQSRSAVPGRGAAPIFMVVILILLGVIIFLLNRIYYRSDEATKTNVQISTSKEKERTPVPGRDDPADSEHDGTGKGTEGGQQVIDARVYFVKINETTDQVSLVPVKRRIRGGNKIEAALKELIRGVSKKEREAGLLSAVPGDLKIRSIRIGNRTATIDFNSSIEKEAAGNILLSRLDQIVYTATQFDDVESVIITINGKKRNTLGSDGLSISGPLHRRE